MNKHTVKNFIDILKQAKVFEDSNIKDYTELVANLTYNSKEVSDGTLFICKGQHFKKEYLEEAIIRGAKFYISETDYEVGIPFIRVNDIRKAMYLVAVKYYENPSNNLTTIGITGTKGKSTTLYFVKSILDTYLASLGKPLSGYTSSVDFYDGIKTLPAHNTTPEAIELQKILRTALDNGIKYFEMEVSSQALKYERVGGMNFNYGIFMNISEDHISPVEHPDFNDYFESKLKIFDICNTGIININSDHFDRIIKRAENCNKIITFGLSKDADIYAYDIKKSDDNGIEFKVKSEDFNEKFEIGMPGIFNVENALAAIALARELDIPITHIREGVLAARCSGRMEVFTSKDGKIISIVDYAHNKLSFENIFKSVKSEYPDRRIVVLFGSTGGKAIDRRKDLGEIAGEMADKIYLTTEDPGEEPAIDIINDIYKYASKFGKPIEIIEDRREAIWQALSDNKEESVYLILGKGAEKSIKMGNGYIDYESDIEIVKEYIKIYDKNNH